MSPTFAYHDIFASFQGFYFFFFWQLNGKKDEEEEEGERKKEKKLPLLSGARMMSWGHLSSWCGGFPSPANYLVQTQIWYGGYEAQIQLLWANKEILRFREWGRDCKWDRRKDTCTAMHAHIHTATTQSHTHPPTHTHKHNHLSFPSIPSDRLMLLRG